MISRAVLVTACLLTLLGCPTDPGSTATDLTWHGDIKPMMETYCTRCHQPDGQGAGDFTNDQVAISLAERSLARVEAGEMPPPAADPDCRDYHGSDRMVMPDAAKEQLAEWIAGGKPEGDPSEYLAVQTQELSLPGADLEVRMEFPYTPTYEDAANPANEYRCFAMEHDRTEPFFITGFAPIVDEPSIVHHIVLFKMPRDELWSDYDAQVGKDCINGTGGAELDGMLAGWAPGALPVVLEPGQGVRVNPEDVIVIQMHYFQSGPDAVGLSDQSGYQFTTAEDVDTPLRMFPFGFFDFNIPAGADDHSERDMITIPDSVAVTVHTLFPHMHVLGTRYRVWAEDDAGDTCLAEGDYSFDNQLSYQLKQPFTVAPGQSVGLECTWDNSTGNPNQFYDPPQDVRYGERTDEEMCFAFALASITFQ